MTAFEYVLALGDDALIAAQRMALWCSRAPELEEDVALANIALDWLGQSRALLSHAALLEGAGRDEDALAFQRAAQEFANVQLVELPDDDFAVAMVKLLFFSLYQEQLYSALSDSTDTVLAGIAAKALPEVRYHVDHAQSWTVRLGDGTEESHRRMRQAMDRLWPYTHALFLPTPRDEPPVVDGIGVNSASLREPWAANVAEVLTAATLATPEDTWIPQGGLRGGHTERFGHLIAQMQSVHRAFPGARW